MPMSDSDYALPEEDGQPQGSSGGNNASQAPAPEDKTADIPPEGGPKPDPNISFDADIDKRQKENQSQLDYALKQYDALSKQTQAHIDTYQQKSQEALRMQQEYLMQQDQAIGEPPRPQAPPAGPDQQAERKRQVMSTLGYMAVAIPLAFLLGRKGGYAASAAMSAFGMGLQQLVKGQKEESDSTFARWLKQSELAANAGREQLNYYKEVLANKRLNTDSKMKLMGMIAQSYEDPVLADQARLKNQQGVINNLEKTEQALNKYRASVPKIAGGVFNKGDMAQMYRQIYWQKFNHDPGLPEYREEAAKRYPFSQFVEEYYGVKEKPPEGTPSHPGKRGKFHVGEEGEGGQDDPLGLFSKGDKPFSDDAKKKLERYTQ
jgi:hypothetical protein